MLKTKMLLTNQVSKAVEAANVASIPACMKRGNLSQQANVMQHTWVLNVCLAKWHLKRWVPSCSLVEPA